MCSIGIFYTPTLIRGVPLTFHMPLLPSVKVISAEEIALHMGHKFYKGYYDAEKALIFLNSDYGQRFWCIFHELGHHLLCLLPRNEFVYELNMKWDWLDYVLDFKKIPVT